MANPPPNYRPGIGRLATDRYDFQNHLEGINPPGITDFRHTADQIDMNPPVNGGATTVQGSLSNIESVLAGLTGAGQGYVTVGDGYNTWLGSSGLGPGGGYNFDPTIPSLDTLLNPVFASILAFQAGVFAGLSTPPPVVSGFSRIEMGGIVVIKAGTYIVKKTINVPPGITLIGEGYGTKIINATNLNTSTLPPTPLAAFGITNATNTSPIQITTASPIPNLATGDIVHIAGVGGNLSANSQYSTNPFTVTVINATTFSLNGTTGSGTYTSGGAVTLIKPIFNIVADAYRTTNDVAIDPSGNVFGFERETKILNMVIADNFVEPTILGDSYYKLPQNYTAVVSSSPINLVYNPPPLVLQQSGSSLVLDQVELIGRAATNQWTGSAVWLDTAVPVSTGSMLKINDCTIDGFSIPLVWLNPYGGADYLEVTNSKVRSFGNYEGLSSGNNSNNIFTTNDCTSKITNNILYGNGSNILCALFINATVSVAPNLQQRGKVLLAMNDIIINKSSNTTISFTTIYIDSGITNPSTYISTMEYGNCFQDNFHINLNGTSVLTASSTLVTVPALSAGTLTTSSIIGPVTITGTTAFSAGVYNNINQLWGSITSSTGLGTSPIVVTVPSTSLLSTGDIVYIYGATGSGVNTGINGLWIITILSSTTFSLNNSSGTGPIGSGTVNNGLYFVMSHTLNTNDYCVIVPTNFSLLSLITPTFPIFPSIGSDYSAYVNVTSGVAYISLQSGTEANAISASQGAGLVGQQITVSNMEDSTLNGTFTITSYTPSISGTTASVVTTGSFPFETNTLTGGSGFTPTLVGQPITLSNASSSGHNGTFIISAYVSPTSIKYTADSGGGTDANNGHINWYIPGIATYNTAAGNEVDGGDYAIGNNFALTLPPTIAPYGTNYIIKDGGGASSTAPVVINTANTYQCFDGIENGINTYSIVTPSTSVSLVGVEYVFGVGTWYII